MADLLRGPERHRLLRQRARIPGAGRLLPAACRHDDDSGSLGRQSADGREAPRFLRISRRHDGAVGRPRRDRLHRRPQDRRNAGPQRLAARALSRHQGRPHRHGVRDGRPEDSGGRDRHQVAAAARQDAAGRPRAGPSHSRRRDQGEPRQEPSLSEVARAHPDRAGGAARRSGQGRTLQPAAVGPAAGVRLQPGRHQHPDDADGFDGGRGDGIDGQRHADLGAVGPAQAALYLFQAELRAGDEPPDRPDPGGARDEVSSRSSGRGRTCSTSRDWHRPSGSKCASRS